MDDFSFVERIVVKFRVSRNTRFPRFVTNFGLETDRQREEREQRNSENQPLTPVARESYVSLAHTYDSLFQQGFVIARIKAATRTYENASGKSGTYTTLSFIFKHKEDTGMSSTEEERNRAYFQHYAQSQYASVSVKAGLHIGANGLHWLHISASSTGNAMAVSKVAQQLGLTRSRSS